MGRLDPVVEGTSRRCRVVVVVVVVVVVFLRAKKREFLGKPQRVKLQWSVGEEAHPKKLHRRTALDFRRRRKGRKDSDEPVLDRPQRAVHVSARCFTCKKPSRLQGAKLYF